jgi:D-glycero-alpha-D-manno-heptose-7-phosphate kinase
MIITRTPFRVSFTGGGSDLREYYVHNGYGAVISTAIQKYIYIVIHPYFQSKIRIKYSKTEDVETVDEIQHPIVRECLRKVRIDTGIEIASFADVPAGTGLGSSSSFTVGLLHALYAYQGKIVPKERIAREACEIEIDILKEPIGKQDQYAAAFGNINYIRFNKDETVDVSPILLTDTAKQKIEQNLCLYYVGGKRKAGGILSEQKQNMSTRRSMQTVQAMVSLTGELQEVLQKEEIGAVGTLLHKGWLLKKDLASGISNDEIDGLYAKALQHGAIGGKLLGAGGTGFLLLYSEDHAALGNHLRCRTLPFQIDREGTKVLFYD